MTNPASIAAQPPAKRRWRWTGFVLLAITAVLVSLPFGMHAKSVRAFPDAPEPFDLKVSGEIPLPQEQNAFEHFRKAAATLAPLNSMLPDQQILSGVKWSEWQPAYRNWLASNGEAVKHFHRGAECLDGVDIQPKNFSYTYTDPRIVFGQKEVVYLVALDAVRREAEADWGGAWEDYRAILQGSRHFGRHGGFMERARGAEYMIVGANGAIRWSAQPDVNARLLRVALKDVLELRSRTAPLSANLQAEYFYFGNLVELLFNENLAEDSGFQIAPAAAGSDWMQTGWFHNYLKGEPEISRRVARLVWKNWMSQVDKPLYQRAEWGRGDLFQLDLALQTANLQSDEELHALVSRTTFAVAYLPATRRMLPVFDRDACRQGLLELALALQLYAREHDGSLPETLDGLRPKYLKELPIDPFGKGEVYRYRRESSPAGFVVWSVDEDGRDGGAKVGEYGVSKGDIVVRSQVPQAQK